MQEDIDRIFINNKLLNFFDHADLGNAFVRKNGRNVETNIPLIQSLPLLNEFGFVEAGTAVTLLFIYALRKKNFPQGEYRSDGVLLSIFPEAFEYFLQRGYNSIFPISVVAHIVHMNEITQLDYNQQQLYLNRNTRQELSYESDIVMRSFLVEIGLH